MAAEVAQLVLSLFPGIGLLDRAFEDEGFTVVRGPDLLWGGDIHRFHVMPGRFDGVIGGPPCQAFSSLAALNRAQGREPKFGNLIPEFERVVAEAQPLWFIMENVPNAPVPCVPGYSVHDQTVNNRWLGEEQNRKRRISFGTWPGLRLDLEPDCVPLEQPLCSRAVTSNVGGKGSPSSAIRARRGMPAVTSSDGGAGVRMWRYKLPDACRLQGLPEDFLGDAHLTAEGKLRAVANGVPLPMGRAIARAVKRALEINQ